MGREVSTPPPPPTFAHLSGEGLPNVASAKSGWAKSIERFGWQATFALAADAVLATRVVFTTAGK
jgi:hypothetical protein